MGSSEILLEAGTNELEVVEFYIDSLESHGAEENRISLCVNVAKVLEVIESPGFKVSAAAEHPCYLGTMSLREKILPVLDLAVWLGIEKQAGRYDLILVSHFNQKTVGFLVSGVVQIHRIRWEEVLSPSRYISAIDNSCVTAVVKLGDRFSLMLDMESIILDLDPDSEVAPQMEENIAIHGKHALIADDSLPIREMLRQNMQKAGFKVTLVNNGQEALSYLTKNMNNEDLQVDIVISDIEMPSMDGYTLTRNIRSHADLHNLPIILFSSLITEALEHKGQSVGADAQISKPEFNNLGIKALELIHSRENI